MLARIKEIASSRSQNGWQRYFWERVGSVGVFLRADGLRAAALGFVAGLLLVGFFRWVVYLTVVAVLFGYIIWFWAEES